MFSTLQPVPQAAYNLLTATIARRLTPQPIKLRADIELTCYTPSGIDAIKKALKAGEKTSTEAVPIKAKLVAPPLYVLSTNATDKVRETAVRPHSYFVRLLTSFEQKVCRRRTSRTCHRIHPGHHRRARRQSYRQDEGDGASRMSSEVSHNISVSFFSQKRCRKQTNTTLRN